MLENTKKNIKWKRIVFPKKKKFIPRILFQEMLDIA